jgi:hypothetical protein
MLNTNNNNELDDEGCLSHRGGGQVLQELLLFYFDLHFRLYRFATVFELSCDIK